MSKLLFWDTESTGIPEWKKQSGDKCQPHLVEIGCILADSETQEVIEKYEAIIKPDGWIIPDETIEVHGINNKMAITEGVPEADALTKFIYLHNQCSLRIAHNTTFDNRMIRIALKRYFPDAIGDDDWKDRSKYYCTLNNSKKIMGGKSGHKLPDCLLHFTGKEMVEAHRAMPDAQACMEIYFAIQDQKVDSEIPI